MLNKTISSEDNNNSKIHSNNYLDKEWVHTSGKNINDHSNHRKDEKTNYLTDPTSILPSPTETKTIFGNNKAERIIKKNIDRYRNNYQTKLIFIKKEIK